MAGGITFRICHVHGEPLLVTRIGIYISRNVKSRATLKTVLRWHYKTVAMIFEAREMSELFMTVFVVVGF